ncbi:hypothetical protein LTR36_000311 [Oleoguttula mirabilis]|uniref:Metallo-beta-lactamase domain-containing protein n=1 Tax=Oleoguttula mirabilis TaxID=1507867 RepID=A0AAV9K085_9PEZI|nr:hypothetical protein LTR36_000311 [Oleoguttula mirabilis]
MASLIEVDSLEIAVIIDNELDPISPCPNDAVQQYGSLKDIGLNGAPISNDRGGAKRELRMDVKGEQRHTLLFDTGPEEHAWERNVNRLRADIKTIEAIHLSHWHRDHSGGMLKAIHMINQAKETSEPLSVDLHPLRPDYRGIMAMEPISLEADPTFDEIEAAGGKVQKSDQPHTILDNMFLLSGEIPRTTAYEVGLPRGIRFDASKGSWEADTLIKDERFVMCKLKGKGVVVFTGCSHAGVVNAAKHAVELGNDTPLYAVMGGFHLADADTEKIASTTADLKALDVKLLLAGHCTGWRAKFEIQKEMPGRLVPSFVGSKFVL